MLRSVVVLLLCLVSLYSKADDRSTIVETYSVLLAEFSDQLSSQQGFFKSHPDEYWHWVKNLLVPHWSPRQSLQELAKPEHVAAMSSSQRQKLDLVWADTMQRYAFEILDSYSGQHFTINGVEFDAESADKATLKLTAIWDNFPDLDIDLMLVKDEDEWRFYNIRYGWFSYIGMKKWGYHRGLSQRSFDGFMRTLAEKNNEHFATYCKVEPQLQSKFCHGWMQHIGAM